MCLVGCSLYNIAGYKYLFLVIFGGVIGYSGDDINKFLWMVRIAEGEHPKIVSCFKRCLTVTIASLLKDPRKRLFHRVRRVQCGGTRIQDNAGLPDVQDVLLSIRGTSGILRGQYHPMIIYANFRSDTISRLAMIGPGDIPLAERSSLLNGWKKRTPPRTGWSVSIRW